MNKNEKKARRENLSKIFDLSHTRLKDTEIEPFEHLSQKMIDNVGRSETVKKRIVDFSSDGKFIRNEETTYKIKADSDGRIGMEKHYSYKDDDGQSGSSTNFVKDPREISSLYARIFNRPRRK